MLKCDVSGYAVSANAIPIVSFCSTYCTKNFLFMLISSLPNFAPLECPPCSGGWMTLACVHTLHQHGQRRASRSCPRTSRTLGEANMPSACRGDKSGYVASGLR